jgi:hypothetical protein
MKHILLILMIVPVTCLAQWRSLECIDKSKFSVYIQINEQAKQVKVGDIQATNVSFEKEYILFAVVLPNDPRKWIHMISRSTGNMTVQNQTTQNFMFSHQCKVVQGNKQLF